MALSYTYRNRMTIELDACERVQVKDIAPDSFLYRDVIGMIKFGSGDQETLQKLERIVFDSIGIVRDIQHVDESVILKLCFLKETIFILMETERRFVDRPDLLQDVIKLYWEIYHVAPDTSIASEIALDVCSRYLALCESDLYQDWFDRQTPPSNREEEVEKIVKELNTIEPKTGQESKLREQCLKRAKRWLLRRYNLYEARKIGCENCGWKLFLANWWAELLAVIPFGYVFVILLNITVPALVLSVSYGHGINFVAAGGPYRAVSLAGHPVSDAHHINVFILAVYILVLHITVYLVKILFSSRQREPDLQIHLPRLAAGIVVGYFLLLNDEAWGGVFNIKSMLYGVERNLDWWFLLGGKFLVPLVAVFIYVLIEMNNVDGIKYPLWKKAARLWLRGLAYSALIGVLVSDLFGQAIVERVSKGDPHFLYGLFGRVYPEVIIYLAPLALFIGIFLQLLWQEKPLTEKI